VINRGTVLVIALAGTGLVAAGVAVWYQHQLTRQALDLWGPAAAQLIEGAPAIELVDLRGDRMNGGTTGGVLHSADAVDISHAPGVLHFRRSLLQDANFVWDSGKAPAISNTDWDYAVRFSDEVGSVTITFDLDRGVVADRAVRETAVRLSEKTARGVSRFFDEILQQGPSD
jgi:hypothetical protein